MLLSRRKSGLDSLFKEVRVSRFARGLLGTDLPGPHPRIRLALPFSGVDLASK